MHFETLKSGFLRPACENQPLFFFRSKSTAWPKTVMTRSKFKRLTKNETFLAMQMAAYVEESPELKSFVSIEPLSQRLASARELPD